MLKSGQARREIYLDQAATSYPKPGPVADAMASALDIPGSPSRSAHGGARRAQRLLSSSRKTAAAFFGVAKPDNMIFVPGASFGLTMLIRGACEQFLYENGENSAFCIAYGGGEHNSVTRSLAKCMHALSGQGRALQELIEVPLEADGRLCLERTTQVLEEARPLIFVCQHGSNLSAAINPIEEIAQVCLRLGIAFIVDASQTAGHLSICLDDLAQKGLSAWVCSGHKGLLGPAGSGLVYLAEGFSPQPLVMGGTGSGDQAIDFSQLRRPCDYEAGTIALPAIAGLAAAIAHIDASFEEDSRHINALSDFMIGALFQIEGLRILGPLPVSENASSGDASSVSSLSQRLPLVSLVLDGVSSSELAFLLDSQFGIAARAELHCTPLTHRHLNTYPDGALRLSWNAHTTHEDLQTAVAAIKHIAKMRA